MRIAVPVFNGRVSPVFDVARRLLLFELEGGKDAVRSEEHLQGLFMAQRARRLGDLKVDVLICGGISLPMASMIQAYGIQVIPWVAGNVDEVIAAYQNRTLLLPRFAMPGWCGRRRGTRHGPPW